MSNNERRPAEVHQFFPTNRILSETKQTQETEHDLKLSLGGIYRDPIKGKTLMRSSSIAEMQNDKNIPGSFLSLSRSYSLPVNTNMNIGELYGQSSIQGIHDRIRPRNGYPYRQLFIGDRHGSDLHRIDCALQRNYHGSNELSYLTARLGGRVNADGYLKPIPQHEIPNPNSISYYRQSTTNTHINAFSNIVKSWRRPPISPAILSHEIVSNKRPRLAIPEDDKDLILRSMPAVTATGDGPGGRRVEGFLYRYTREEISIVCVCHGRFLTPAEFVEHAGGKNVGDPMKRIIVLGVSFA